MKGLHAYWHRLRLRLREPGSKKKLYVFLVCLVCSAFFWLFIKLSRETQMVFEQPLVVVNASADRVVSQQSSTKVQYTLQSTGARRLLSRYFMPADTLRVEAVGLGKVTRNGALWHYISPLQLRSRLSERLDASSQLSSLWHDTVFVKLDYASRKRLPVKLNASYSIERRFGPYGEVRLTPDSVSVRGPSQVIDTLQVILTEPLVFENLMESVRQPVALVNPADGQGLSLEVNQAELVIPVEEFTETLVELYIAVACPHGEEGGEHQLRLFPNRVALTCLVALKDYGRVEASQFVAHVLCPGDNPGDLDRLEVFVDTFPDFVSIQSIKPSMVEFLILE